MMSKTREVADLDSFALCKSSGKALRFYRGESHTSNGFVIRDFEAGSNYFLSPADIIPVDVDMTKELYSGSSTSFETYKSNFDVCQKLIDEGALDKIILSRLIWIPTEVEPLGLFNNLQKKYSAGYNFLLNHPKVGMWIGSSPEVLVKENTEGFETMALAGTKNSFDDADWGEKELEEQAIVVRFIEKELSLAEIEYTTSELGELNTGVVKHLINRIQMHSDAAILEIAGHLHPTPAICGLPRERAFQEIKNIEEHERGLYCGYLGTVEDENTDELYVALRCARIFANGILLYVGGGITKDSILEDEWEETSRKARTIKDLL